MKKLLYLFLAITIASCSNTTPANSSNTLLLENNGFKLTFDEAGFKVNNTKGDYLILDADGIKMSKVNVYGGLNVNNSNGTKFLATITEDEYKNNRGKGGELRLYSNFEGEYSGLKVASNIDILFSDIERLFNIQNKKSNTSNSIQNTIGKACVKCEGTGLVPDYFNPRESENCDRCDGTGRIFN